MPLQCLTISPFPARLTNCGLDLLALRRPGLAKVLTLFLRLVGRPAGDLQPGAVFRNPAPDHVEVCVGVLVAPAVFQVNLVGVGIVHAVHDDIVVDLGRRQDGLGMDFADFHVQQKA